MPKAPKITYTTLFADESIHPKYEAALKKFASKQLGRHHPMHIGAREVRSGAGEFEHRSPIDTSIVVSYFPIGQREHAKKAVEAAKLRKLLLFVIVFRSPSTCIRHDRYDGSQ